MAVNRLLYMGNAYDIQFDPSRVYGKDLRKFFHLFTRLHIRIGITVKVYRLYFHAALGDHVSRHGAVDPAGKKQQPFSRRPDRHTARALDDPGKDERIALFPYINADDRLRRMHVYAERRIIGKQAAAYLRIDLHGVQWKTLVAPVCLYLERAALRRDEQNRFVDGLHIRRYQIADT